MGYDQFFQHEPNSYWIDSVERMTFQRLDEKLKVDVGIVGAGITGITTAYLLAKQGLDVCLIDANKLMGGTTAHTTAKVTAQHGLIYDEIIQHYGLEYAQSYYAANDEAARFVEETIKNHDIECDYETHFSYVYTNDETYVKKLEQEYESYERIGIEGRLLDSCNVPIPVQRVLQMKSGATFHPLRYLQALLNECIERGVKIYDKTRAINVEYAKHPAIITENGHRIICSYVVQASNYPFYDGTGFYPTKMYADRSYAVAVKTDKLIDEGIYLSAESPKRSLRTVKVNGERALLVVGENHKVGQSKQQTTTHYESLYRFADTHFNVQNTLYHWSAQDLTTLDKLPYVGRVAKGNENVFVATGFRKWGMTNGTNAALLIRDLIMENDNPLTQLFSPARELKFDPAIKKLITFNTDVAKHLIKGKLKRPPKEIEPLAKGEAKVVTYNNERAGVYKDEHGDLYIVDTTCTHLGCELNWNEAEKTWDCPCHGSRFSYRGEVIHGPAVQNLQTFTNEEE